MIKIISDSASLYSKKEALAAGIDISSLAVTIDHATYKEYEDIDTKTFIDIINKGHIPTSSQPSIGEVLDVYNDYPDAEIINISMADGLSGTYSSACMAKEMVQNPERIHVINSKTLCGPQKYLVDLALALAKSGKSSSEIIDTLTMQRTKSYLIPHDFDYLVRGGRLSPLVGKIGGLIKLVPVTILSEDGKSLDKFTTSRGFKKAIQKICADMLEDGVSSAYQLYITHAMREDLALEAKSVILDYIPNANIEIKLLGPAFTTQGGPGCVAIQWIKKHDLLA
ncbi:MAG: DegV family protein [Niameybacter sp.]|uniref:DegV family protein n=1 Tax=Niameybacter sp. TaxID=2033640 RepID=UPI002FC80A67